MKSLHSICMPRALNQTTEPGSRPGWLAFRFTISTGVSCRSSDSISRRCFSFTFCKIQLLYSKKTTRLTPTQDPVTLYDISRDLQPHDKGSLHCSDLSSDAEHPLLRGFHLKEDDSVQQNLQ